jgi:hypothetical protein
MEEIVFLGLVMACLFAGSPTFLSPFSKKATMEGVVRRPSLFGITTGSFPSITETQLFVVPRSMPITFLIVLWLIISFLFFPKKSIFLPYFNGR